MSLKKWSFSGGGFEDEFGYSRAVRQGNQILVSGCAPLERDGSSKKSAAEQTNRCFEIISDALNDLGGTMNDVVRVRLYLTDPQDLRDVMAIYRNWLGEARPAATAIVARLLDESWKVEIEAEAITSG